MLSISHLVDFLFEIMWAENMNNLISFLISTVFVEFGVFYQPIFQPHALKSH